jgi:hypothetical protein
MNTLTAKLGGKLNAPYPSTTNDIGAQSNAITWWASVGAFFVALQAYIFGAWIMSPHFTPTPPGDSPLHWYPQLVMAVIQFGAPALVLCGVAWIVYETRKEGRIPTLGLIIIGWASAYWQDPLINYVRPAFSYNSHFVNFGSWCELVPGWMAPNGSKMPEPLFFGLGAYAFVIPTTALICAFAMRTAKRLRPRTTSFQLILVAFVTMFWCDLVVEALLVASHMYAYLGSIHALSLFPGTLHQFPLYESMLGGATVAATGSLFHFRDDRGNTLVERGVQNLRVRKGVSAIRALAVIGFVNIVVLSYTILYIFINLQMDAWPQEIPSYLRNGICGEGTSVNCPAPGMPIPTVDSVNAQKQALTLAPRQATAH